MKAKARNFLKAFAYTALLSSTNPGLSAENINNTQDFKSEAYQSKTAEEKRDLIWKQIHASRWDKLPPLDGTGWASLLTNLRAALTLSPTMDLSSDVLPKGRVKFIHAYGLVGAVQWLPNISEKPEFTGIFSQETLGLIRLSIAADPKRVSFTPGLALKLMIDGKPSLNVLAMPSLDGQGENQNFFAFPFTTHIEEPQNPVLKVLSWWFNQTEHEPNKLPVDQLAAITPSGRPVLDAKAPKILEFVPDATLANRYSANSDQDYRINLGQINPGRLFTVYGKSDLNSSQRVLLGELILEAPMIASEFGDKQLFFRHMRKKQ